MAEFKNIHEALLDLQREGVKLIKDAKNPFFNSSYITLGKLLDVVLPLLHERNMVLVQQAHNVGSIPTLAQTIYHIPSETFIQAEMPLILEKDNPQGHGSAITYARRYALMTALAFVADEDDDGNAASSRKPAKREVVNPAPEASTPKF